MSKLKPFEQRKQEFFEKHGNGRFQYPEETGSNNTKFTVICLKDNHGEFVTTPIAHLRRRWRL